MSKNEYPLVSLAYEHNIVKQWMNKIFMIELGKALGINLNQQCKLSPWYLKNNFFTYFVGDKIQ